MLTKAVEIFFVLLLAAGVPALSFATVRRSRLRLIPRLALYFSAVFSQWILAAIGLAVVLVAGPNIPALGFRGVPATVALEWTLLLAALSLAALGIILLLERFDWWPQESELVHLLVPATRVEKIWAVFVVAPTAALCEEFLYRGYLLAVLSQWFHATAWGWALSSAAFGLAHLYQGLNGAVRAALLGALLAWPVVRCGSLYPSMAAHFLIDALALAWLGPRFLKRQPPL